MPVQRFAFRFDPTFRVPLALLGIRPQTCVVLLDDEELVIRFGRWGLRTARANVVGAQQGGPYRWWRAVGPHLSLADRGVTFGTGTTAGVCLRFGTPVPGLAPGRWLRHPAATVTVTDPAALLAALHPAPAGHTRPA
ncbi:hypothetical protein AB0K20_08875 [Micromonospora matsumotoense]|uniref:Uncharacterized protein n=1 Tax=Micromonospora matsumotoense TaxID=121616 RepID=A0A1C5AEG0_9ACTN|nr:hypothetical protein [Micromonospora matsumotoense]SCF43471.1 hypothetical protein GA0070216_11665 [Micromonospora matsumotoense]